MCVCSVAESCPTLGDSMDCSLPGSSVRGIFQARALELVAISYSRGSPQGSNHVLCFLHWQVDSLPPALWEAQSSSVSTESAYSAGDPGSIPGLGRSPGEGNGCSPWGHKELDTTERPNPQIAIEAVKSNIEN